MANVLTYVFRNLAAGSNANQAYVDFIDDTISAMFVDGADDVPLVTNDDMEDIASAARVPAVASCPILGSKTVGVVAQGVADCADILFPVLSGDQVEYLILFKNTGTESTSTLIAIYDTATGLPLTPTGGDVTVVPSTSGLYKF